MQIPPTIEAGKFGGAAAHSGTESEAEAAKSAAASMAIATPIQLAPQVTPFGVLEDDAADVAEATKFFNREFARDRSATYPLVSQFTHAVPLFQTLVY